MFKKRVLGISVIAFAISFSIHQLSWGLSAYELENHYPDYSTEFAGKDCCEKFNRKLFTFNLKLNKHIIRPINIVWASIMPKYGIDRMSGMYQNINYPIRLVSTLLQKDFKTSRQETVRFLVNTTVGVCGMYDPAKSKLHIEPRQEDMAQALAHLKVKKGPYLVLPIVRGNIRDLVGQLLDYPLRPFSYIPVAGGIANAVFSLNNATYSQPIIKKVDESYADPYEIARQYDGISRYIKNENLDREEILREKTISQNIVPVCNTSCAQIIKPDIELKDFNPQSPMIDSMRTSLFRELGQKKSKWADLSVWNRSFSKKIKLSAVKIEKNRPEYKYRYLLQNSKNSPVAILYPSIGEGIYSEHSDVLAKILYLQGYSVVIVGSAFHWEFVKSMPSGFSPGYPSDDAKYLRQLGAKIFEDLQKKKGYVFGRRILLGTSYGAMTSLFVAAQEEAENTLNISKCIAVNPPIELFYALRKLDKDCEEWKADTQDLQMKTAVIVQKVVNTTSRISKETPEDVSKKGSEYLPFTDDEAKMIIGFIMKQKLSDVVFSLENQCRTKKCCIYNAMNKMGYENYGEKYVFSKIDKAREQIDYESSLHYISEFLKSSDKIKIYHTADDFFVNQQQLAWLKNETGDKTTIFSNGSHLGFLYRKEFVEQLIHDVNTDKMPAEEQKLRVEGILVKN